MCGAGAYLLASYEPSSATFQPICKLGTGFTDEQLAAWTAVFRRTGTGTGTAAVSAGGGGGEEEEEEEGVCAPPASVDLPEGRLPPSLQPDAWIEPSVVWEVRALRMHAGPHGACERAADRTHLWQVVAIYGR